MCYTRWMEIKLVYENCKPLSVNHAYFNVKRGKRILRILNDDAKILRDKIHERLRNKQVRKQLKLMRDSFIREKHKLEIEIVHKVPVDKFYTKEGYISRHSGDIDNILKLLIDFTLNPKYPDALGIDDTFVSKILVEKIPTENISNSIEISIKLLNI